MTWKMPTRYHRIADMDSTAQRACKWCPKFSRYKLAILIILVLSIIFISLSCLNYNFIHSATLCLFSFRDGDNTSLSIDDGMHFHHAKRRLPQCLIIGARKAGTRALLQFIRLHPDVQGASLEVHFFDRDNNYQLGYDWYRHQMPYSFKDQVTIEKSPAYFTESVAPERVYVMNSSIRLLLIVRDPVERTISDYAQLLDNKVKRHKTMQSFEKLVLVPDTGEINKSYIAVKRSIYHRHLLKWLHFFPLKQIHIIDGDNLRVRPWAEIHKVESYLGLEHKIGKNRFVFNTTRGVFCTLTEEGEERCLAHGKGRKHPNISEVVMHKLRAFFRPYNEKFFRIIKRRFQW
ncbi:heparan sulfate glucosamine 3-O-sulfotransferase 1-like [Haliotis rubra]|uniref:heparan sulfate glucosamine 3-O-sulfotransferase 1-like n=1 Tax=Haliotis rubra TaxID=36100 RepID=UPI001EE6232D|nr:heparan sulfate glucosamine 3-O-sulfotransferase 1-like [Haliotis rubra]XP_046566833.1 heparan sulfate glucosamine 3-O-sulfotransferase 1-like [Haliotis rubra]